MYDAIAIVKDAANKTESDYVNLNFILASAAEVEHIWSMAKYILVQQRKGMLPKLFECLIFLKYKNQFWTRRMVIKAYRMAKEKCPLIVPKKLQKRLKMDVKLWMKS